jgi:hypothetical protein
MLHIKREDDYLHVLLSSASDGILKDSRRDCVCISWALAFFL